jgi:adenine deaminase
MPDAKPSFAISGNIVDIDGRRTFPGTIEVRDGRIAAINADSANHATYLLPGFVDAHVHIESSMLPPTEFARLATAHGTVATVSDPHEIANVLGIPGVRYMLENARRTPLKIAFGAPSCVPACAFDVSGATLGPKEVAELLDLPDIKYLSEMMNYPGVVQGDADVLAKIEAARVRGKPVDGHAPRLRGADLVKYHAAGITTDHECITRDEGRERLELGMKLLIREGSAARNFEALYPLVEEFPELCMFCSDDKHPHDLAVGQINQLVARATAGGVDLFKALRAACINPVEHYGLDVGLLRVGDPADFIVVSDLAQMQVQRTYIDGQLVAEGGKSLLAYERPEIVNQFNTPLRRPEEFQVVAAGSRVRVIEAQDGQLTTRAALAEPKVVDGQAVADISRDLLKMALINRYQGGPPALGFVRGFGLRRGAIASSVAHDSHNIVAVGTDDRDLAAAVNALIEHRGGVSVAHDGHVEVLPLPIAGLMSDADGMTVGRCYERLDTLAKELGTQLAAPFVTLSFMALLVIPDLKLGPCGVFDVLRFEPVELFASDA